MLESPGDEETARSHRSSDSAPAAPGERTALLRRSATRGLAGLLAIALVLVLEVVRRSGENSPSVPKVRSPVQQASAPPTAPTLPPVPQTSGSDSLGASSLVIDFEHGLRSGTLVLFVDDEKLLEQDLSSRIAGKFLGFTRRRGRVHETLAVPPGRRQLRVEVSWAGKQRSRTIVATFKEGVERRLAVRLFGITKSLTLEWE